MVGRKGREPAKSAPAVKDAKLVKTARADALTKAAATRVANPVARESAKKAAKAAAAGAAQVEYAGEAARSLNLSENHPYIDRKKGTHAAFDKREYHSDPKGIDAKDADSDFAVMGIPTTGPAASTRSSRRRVASTTAPATTAVFAVTATASTPTAASASTTSVPTTIAARTTSTASTTTAAAPAPASAPTVTTLAPATTAVSTTTVTASTASDETFQDGIFADFADTDAAYALLSMKYDNGFNDAPKKLRGRPLGNGTTLSVPAIAADNDIASLPEADIAGSSTEESSGDGSDDNDVADLMAGIAAEQSAQAVTTVDNDKSGTFNDHNVECVPKVGSSIAKPLTDDASAPAAFVCSDSVERSDEEHVVEAPAKDEKPKKKSKKNSKKNPKNLKISVSKKGSKGDWRGTVTGKGHSEEKPPESAEEDYEYLNSPWNCGFRDCATSQTWVNKDVYKRKVISTTFGRNKACATAIPDGVWNFWCRKSYQTWTYQNKHHVTGQERVQRIAAVVRDQVQRFETWRPNAKFIIALSSDAEKSLAIFQANVNQRVRQSQEAKDGKPMETIEAEAQQEIFNNFSRAHAEKLAKKKEKKQEKLEEKEKAASKGRGKAKGKGKKRDLDEMEGNDKCEYEGAAADDEEQMEPPYPCKLLEELKENLCSTKAQIKNKEHTKLYSDLETAISWAVEKGDTEQAVTFPPVEFLMEFVDRKIPRGEDGETTPANNYQHWYKRYEENLTEPRKSTEAESKRRKTLKLNLGPRPVVEKLVVAGSSTTRCKKRNAPEDDDAADEAAPSKERGREGN